MAKAFRFHRTGGPEVLQWEAVDVGAPGPGEVRVRHHAVGLNFADTYFRTGLYPAPLPAGMGVEAAGVVEAVGPGVTRLRRGRPGDLHRQPARRLQHRAGDGHRAADQAPRRHRLRHRGGDDDARPDDVVPAPQDRSALRRRHGAAARRRRRRWPDLQPVGARARHQGDRHRVDGGEGRDRPRSRVRRDDLCTGTRTSRPGSASSPTAQAYRSPTTASARRPSSPLWTQCGAVACWSASVRRPGRSRRSTPWNWR